MIARATAHDLEREAAAASIGAGPKAIAASMPEPLKMLVRRGIQPSLLALDLPFDPDRIDADALARHLDGYAFRLFLRGAILSEDTFTAEQTSRFLTHETATEAATALVALGLAEAVGGGAYRLIRRARSFGATLEWYVARELGKRCGVDAIAGVKFHAKGVGGDLDVIASAEGKVIVLELKSSPPKHLRADEVGAFFARTRALRPDIAVFAMDTALRLGDKVVPLLVEGALPSNVVPRRVLGVGSAERPMIREIWALSPHVYVVNAKPSLISNIARAIAEGLRALSPEPL